MKRNAGPSLPPSIPSTVVWFSVNNTEEEETDKNVFDGMTTFLNSQSSPFISDDVVNTNGDNPSANVVSERKEILNEDKRREHEDTIARENERIFEWRMK
jgi:hypothetical protein